MFLCLMKDWLSNWRERMFIVKPDTVIKWHRTALSFIGDETVNQKEEGQK